MPEIISIWQESFGDTKEEIVEFLNAFSARMRVFVWKEQKQVAGQLCLLPVTLSCKKQKEAKAGVFPAEYIYAVATAAGLRGRGIGTALLGAASDMLRAEGKAGILVPADEALAVFYKERGFRNCFRGETLTERLAVSEGRAANACRVRMQEMDAGGYLRLRKKAFEGKSGATLQEDFIAYAIRGYERTGVSCVRIDTANSSYGVLYRLNGTDADTEVSVMEITAKSKKEAAAVLRLLLQGLGRKSGSLRYSSNTCCINLPEDIRRRFWKEGSFNLVLD